ncbi:MAG: kynureninase [Comamonas sp.]
MTTLEACREVDLQEPLAPLRDWFDLPEGVIYLDGNSLGPLPRATGPRLAQMVQQEWGQGLIRSWNDAGWITLPQRLGDQFAPWVGARAGELVFTDTTSVNLYKVLSAAIRLSQAEFPGPQGAARTRLVSERSNFPTDLYIAESLCKQHGLELVLIEPEELPACLTQDVAVLLLSHVNYRTGHMHDTAAVTREAHAQGILTVWDLCHSAGAVPVDLNGANADYAVGCSYKYLNGGPGAPAFVWANARHTDKFWQPLSGWFGHAEQFAFTSDYQPASGIRRYMCGTQPMISLTALQCGLDVYTEAEQYGGMVALRRKSLALTDLFIALVEERCAGHGLGLATPRDIAQRGSQVCLTRDTGAYAIVQALIARGVIGDFRKGDGGNGPHKDILRFGFTPLYTRFEDVWNAVEHLRQVLESGEWQRPEFNRINAVT